MERKEIKAKIDEVKAQIKANSKDAHFAEKLIGDLLSLKGQYEHQPTMVYVAMDDIVDTIEGDTFTLYKLNDGRVGFHLKSGYDVVVSPRIEALNGNLKWYIDNKKTIDESSEEEQELYQLDFECTQHILTMPLFTATDYDLKYKVSNLFIETLLKAQETLENSETLVDDLAQNVLFEDASIAVEDIRSDIDKEVENLR